MRKRQIILLPRHHLRADGQLPPPPPRTFRQLGRSIEELYRYTHCSVDRYFLHSGSSTEDESTRYEGTRMPSEGRGVLGSLKGGPPVRSAASTHLVHTPCFFPSMAVSTPVPVANRTPAYRSLESGLRPHETKIDRPRSVRAPLTLSYFRTYILYVRNPKTVATPVHIYIYVHGIYDRNTGLLPASNRHFTVSPNELFTCFRSVASISQHVYQVGRKVEFARSCQLFLASFGKLRLSDQVRSNAWHGIQRRIIWINFLPWKWS